MPRRERGVNAQTCLSAVLPIALAGLGHHSGVQYFQFHGFAAEGTRIDHTVQEAVGHAPLLLSAMQRDRLVVEPDYPAAALLMVAIDETDNIIDRHLVAAETAPRLLANPDVGAIEIDGRVRNQPALLRGGIKDDCLFAPQLENLAGVGPIRRRIEILDGLPNAQPRLDGDHPSWLVQDAIDGGPQTVKIKRGCAAESSDCFGEIHGRVATAAGPQRLDGCQESKYYKVRNRHQNIG